MPPHLWRCTGLRGPGGRLGWCLLAETLGLVPTGRPQEAAAQEIEVRAAQHLAFHHFQPVDVPLDRAGRMNCQLHPMTRMGILFSRSPIPPIPSLASSFPSSHNDRRGVNRECSSMTRPLGGSARCPRRGRIWPHPIPLSCSPRDALSSVSRICRHSSVCCTIQRRRSGRCHNDAPTDYRTPSPTPGMFVRPPEYASASLGAYGKYHTPICPPGASRGARLAHIPSIFVVTP